MASIYPLTQTAPTTGTPAEPPRLLDRMRFTLRAKHYSYRTEQAYVHRVRRFILFHLPRTCLNREATSAPCKSYWATRMFRRRRFTPMFCSEGLAAYGAPWTSFSCRRCGEAIRRDSHDLPWRPKATTRVSALGISPPSPGSSGRFSV